MRRWIIAGGLLFSTTALADQDGDGYATADDCDDTNPEINPTAPEICDGLDNNCNDQVDEGVAITYWADLDDDGFGDADNAIELCEMQEGYVINSQDCNDGDANINPLAEEICDDDIDNNCNNEIDEGCGGEPSSEPAGEPSSEPSSEPSATAEEDRYAYPTNSGRPDGLDADSSGCGGGKSLLLMSPLLLGLRRRRE